MWIKNVKIFRADWAIKPGVVQISEDRILTVRFFPTMEESRLFFTPGGEEALDGGGGYLLPGFTDIHFHGCMGDDVCDGTPEALNNIAKYEASVGVTQICPATMTLEEDELCKILANLADFRDRQEENEHSGEADLVGVNMEGPFISHIKKGAQNEKYIVPPSSKTFHRYQEAARGLIKIIAIAPEMAAKDGETDRETAEEFIRGVGDAAIVSIAHSNADYDTARNAFVAGAKHGVHIFNAMPEFLHRKPGVIGALFDDERATGELICDGIHIHPSVIRQTWRLLGEYRLILISDSMRATGMPDGVYELGGQDVEVHGNLAKLVVDGTIAGSATTLPDCVRFAIKKAKLPLELAIGFATENPAKRIGIFDKYGSIVEGKIANLVLWDEDLNQTGVIHRGVKIV